jgi:hypothetical protein
MKPITRTSIDNPSLIHKLSVLGNKLGSNRFDAVKIDDSLPLGSVRGHHETNWSRSGSYISSKMTLIMSIATYQLIARQPEQN